MSYPYGPPPQQPGWGQPQQPQQGGWQQPPAPQQPGGWGPPAPGGWQQPQPTQPQWGAPPPQQAPEAPAPVQGSLADYFAQPSTGGGAALKFPQNGSAHFGIVNRMITDADTEQQTGIGANANVGQTFKDGRPKLVLKVPLNVRPSQDHTDGKARLYANPGVRDQLVAAVAASGAPIITHPSGVQYYLPEPGSGIYIQKTGTRPTGAGMNPANVFTVQYFRPEQARQLAQQQGVEYPTVAELAQTADSAPAEQAPPATPPGPPPSTADFAPPTPGQPGNPAQWSQQPAATQQFPQAPGQFPAWGAVDGQQGAPQAPPSAPQQQGPGAPPPVDWATQGQQQPGGGGFIPQATPPADLAPGLTPENQQLLAGLTGRSQQ
jgi:hypothetical protein